MLAQKQRFSFYLAALLSLCLVGILALRLYQLQIVEGAALANLSESNSQRLLHLTASRGHIYAAGGETLATNQLVFEVAVNFVEGVDQEALAKRLAELLDDPAYPAAQITATLQAHGRRYEPVTVARYDYEQGLAVISRLEENRAELPGVQIQEQPQRTYPLGSLAGHLIGSVGMIDAEELAELADAGYLASDWLGKTGLEKGLEQWRADAQITLGLRGTTGIEQVEVTANHRKVQTVFKQAAQAGNNIHLTLDVGLQQALEQSLAETIRRVGLRYPDCRAGAAVLLEVQTGAVLAMASYPTMDPNDFAGGLSADLTAYYWDNEDSPSLNRAISAYYPPGSVFKPITALAILSAGYSPLDTVYCSAAAWSNGDGQARCTGVHGSVNLYRAMAYSCNTYFQEMGARVGIETIAATARALGLGEPSGIELANEVAGLMPTPDWKAENFTGWEESWHLYDTYYTAMGQGYTTATPLQLAEAIATIANNGTRMQPYLLDYVTDSAGNLLYQNEPVVAAQVELPEGYFHELQKAMGSVTAPGGTGYAVFAGLEVQVGGKSGTAQTNFPGLNHGLFVAFAPLDAPQVAVACVIEYGDSGGGSAAYVCRDILAAYFGGE